MSNEAQSVPPAQTIRSTPEAVRPAANAPARTAAPPNKHDELCLLVNSRRPIITVQTTEEGRVDQLLFDVAPQLDVPLYTWSVTVGLARMKGAPLYNTETPEQALTNIDVIHGDGIFVLKDSRDIATTTGRAGGSGSCLRNSEASGAPS